DAQRLGDLLQDLRRRLAQAALDLTEVRVRDARHVGELPQREAGAAALLADELTEVPHPSLDVLHRHGVKATGLLTKVSRSARAARTTGRRSWPRRGRTACRPCARSPRPRTAMAARRGTGDRWSS